MRESTRPLGSRSFIEELRRRISSTQLVVIWHVVSFRAKTNDRPAEQAVALARSGQVEALMKGSQHTDELMHAALAPGIGLATARRMSHVFVMDVSTYPRPLFLTDAALNIYPDLEAKRDIVQNAIDLAHMASGVLALLLAHSKRKAKP